MLFKDIKYIDTAVKVQNTIKCKYVVAKNVDSF